MLSDLHDLKTRTPFFSLETSFLYSTQKDFGTTNLSIVGKENEFCVRRVTFSHILTFFNRTVISMNGNITNKDYLSEFISLKSK